MYVCYTPSSRTLGLFDNVYDILVSIRIYSGYVVLFVMELRYKIMAKEI